jgi:16S rRNA (guanine(966)-N(2))-methyltransferase RsmD
MRIISGEAKGRVLKTREGKGTRPTDARAREMLFNILGARVIGARFLDLYAGNGTVGLEALSRGADFCVFIEQNAAAVGAIRQNLKVFGWQDRAQVWHTTVKAALRRMQEMLENPDEADQALFDIVFADPPFTNARELPDLAARLDNAQQIVKRPGGLLVAQHHRKDTFAPLQFEVQQQRRAGESTLSFAVPHSAAQPPSDVVEPKTE